MCVRMHRNGPNRATANHIAAGKLAHAERRCKHADPEP
jgi:hypothetical protein